MRKEFLAAFSGFPDHLFSEEITERLPHYILSNTFHTSPLDILSYYMSLGSVVYS